MSATQRKRIFDLSGGHVALDFANTVSKRPTAERIDRLPSYDDFLFFAREAGIVPARVFDRLHSRAREAPGRSQAALQQAIELREAIFEIFHAIGIHAKPPENALTIVNSALQSSGAHGGITSKGRHFSWEWVRMEDHLDSILWPIARAAAELLTSDELNRVRVCDSDKCDWLFLDTTKNQRRRWCDMKTCGNRVKAQRHYARLKAV